MSVKLIHYFSITAEVVSFITALLWSIRSENALLKVPPFCMLFSGRNHRAAQQRRIRDVSAAFLLLQSYITTFHIVGC